MDPKLPVFKIQSLDNFGKVRVLHRNMLFPLESNLRDHDIADCHTHGDTAQSSASESLIKPTDQRPVTRSQTHSQRQELLAKANTCMWELFNENHKEPSPMKILRYDRSPVKIGVQAKANQIMWEFFDEDIIEESPIRKQNMENDSSLINSIHGVVNTTLNWFNS